MKSCQVDTELLIHTQTLHVKKNDDNDNQPENITESPQVETSVEPNTNSTKNTQQKPLLQIPEIFPFQDTYWTNTNVICRIATTFL